MWGRQKIKYAHENGAICFVVGPGFFFHSLQMVVFWNENLQVRRECVFVFTRFFIFDFFSKFMLLTMFTPAMYGTY